MECALYPIPIGLRKPEKLVGNLKNGINYMNGVIGKAFVNIPQKNYRQLEKTFTEK